VVEGTFKPALLSVLADAGLPDRPAAVPAEPGGFPWSIVLAALLLVVLAGAAATAWASRRRQPATA
jgi:hypothetical protein